MENSKLPAFPVHDGNLYYAGMTKREYFAGIALGAAVSNQQFLLNLNAEPHLVAQACIEIADELLKQLEK